MKYLVLSVDRYEFQDDKGQTRSGATVWAVNDYRDDTAESAGFKPTKIGIAEELFKTFRTTQLPAMFEVDFSAKPGKDGKPTLVVVDAKHLKPVPLFDKKAA
jgi:hypothetical protein